MKIKKALKRILRSVAFKYSETAGYCQGMNYVVGVLLIYYQNEELAFKMFCQLLEKYMMEIFTDNFDNLQKNFYLVDKLIQLHIPDLYNHFKSERILPVFYCSSWFITIFTNTFQYTHQSFFVLRIMDIYLAQGLKGLLKCIIILLKYLRARFLKMSFDQIMNFLTDLTKKELFTNIQYKMYLNAKQNGLAQEELNQRFKNYLKDFQFLDEFKEKVERLPLSSELVNQLEQKYRAMSKKLSKKL